MGWAERANLEGLVSSLKGCFQRLASFFLKFLGGHIDWLQRELADWCVEFKTRMISTHVTVETSAVPAKTVVESPVETLAVQSPVLSSASDHVVDPIALDPVLDPVALDPVGGHRPPDLVDHKSPPGFPIDSVKLSDPKSPVVPDPVLDPCSPVQPDSHCLGSATPVLDPAPADTSAGPVPEPCGSYILGSTTFQLATPIEEPPDKISVDSAATAAPEWSLDKVTDLAQQLDFRFCPPDPFDVAMPAP
jgi:hypothetical protein